MLSRSFLLLCVGLLLGTSSVAWGQNISTAQVGTAAVCSDGAAAGFSCNSVNLQSFLPVADLGGSSGARLNDIWGWTDPETGREYALVGRTDGTGFVDVTDPLNPFLVGNLPIPEGGRQSIWRDLKVYDNHVYIVADGASLHGLQVLDLTQLRSVSNPPVTFEMTAHYIGFGSAHNIVINEETGFAYAVGISVAGETCGGGYHMINIQIPDTPRFVGCFAHPGTGRAATGYTHDAQCVVYQGPDEAYQGHEICFGANETGLSIADLTVKGQPDALSVGAYPNVAYAHQVWLTDDHRYLLLDDELDEGSQGFNARTIVWDVADLDDPQVVTEYFAPTPMRDHNLYIRGNFAFQANYSGGFRVLDISNPAQPFEAAFFDTNPGGDNFSFNGAWSTFPFFNSGTVVVSSVGEGLFVLQPTIAGLVVGTETDEVPASFSMEPAFPNPFRTQTTVALSLNTAQRVTVTVYDVLGREVARLHQGVLAGDGEVHRFTFDAEGLPGGLYVFRALGENFISTRLVTRTK